MAIIGDLAQTFFLDPDAVKASRYAFISSVKLFFKDKPVAGTSTSGLPTPGVTIFITETKQVGNFAVPDLDNLRKYGRSRLEYASINTSPSGDVATVFNFKVPVPLETNKIYAVVVAFDGRDRGFSLWRNKAGETYNGTVSPTITKGALDGNFYILTGGKETTPDTTTDLKFHVNVQRFDITPTTYRYVNRNFEIIDYVNLNGTFRGGEYVFANNGYPSGQTVLTTVTSNTITGTATTFLSTFVNNSLIVLNSGTTNAVRRVVSIANNTTMVLDYPPPFSNGTARYLATAVAQVYDFYPGANTLTLVSSTANNTTNFIANSSSNTVIGVTSNAVCKINKLLRFNVDEFTPRIRYLTPPGTNVNTFIRFANSSYNTVDSLVDFTNGVKKRFTDFPAFLYSASDEVTSGNGSVGSLSNQKSVNFETVFSSINEFASPLIDEEDLEFNVYRRIINEDLTNEHKNYGNALSKYVSKRIVLAEGQEAEDIKVYLTAFRPANTDVKVYVKFYNESDPEVAEDKDWTPLECISPANLFSSLDNYRDYVDLEYKLPAYPVANTETLSAGISLEGTFTGADSNNVFVGTGSTVNTGVANGDLVRIYNPLFPNNSLVAVVTDSNTTTFTIDTPIYTANTRTAEFVTAGLLAEKITLKNTAFNNYTSNGVIRYYNTAMSAFDTYNSFAFKIILTGSNNSTIYPFVEDIRGIACSI